MRAAISTLLLASVTLLAGAATSKPKSSPTLAVIDAAQRKVVAILNDPESARFRDVGISPSTKAVCGFVNAKNAYGGYPGFKRFIVTEAMTKIEGTDAAAMDYRWLELCDDSVPSKP